MPAQQIPLVDKTYLLPCFLPYNPPDVILDIITANNGTYPSPGRRTSSDPLTALHFALDAKL
jgi:hypothetical protein